MGQLETFEQCTYENLRTISKDNNHMPALVVWRSSKTIFLILLSRLLWDFTEEKGTVVIN